MTSWFSFRRVAAPCAAACSLGLSALFALAQIPVNGLADKSVYVDQVSFSIPAEPGFSYSATLDGLPVPINTTNILSQVDYHQLLVQRTNTSTLQAASLSLQFLIRSSERGDTENGLPPWTPYPTIPSSNWEFAGATLQVVTPMSFPPGYPIPVVARINNPEGHALRVNGILEDRPPPPAPVQAPPSGYVPVRILRGNGSGFLAGTGSSTTSVTYEPRIAGLAVTNTIQIDPPEISWITVSGVLDNDTIWPPNSRIHITGHLTNSPGRTLAIGAGSVVRVSTSVDIYNFGHIVINGTLQQPVVLMPATFGQYWGGFIQHANNASLTAAGTIFTGSGANQGCWFSGHGCSSSLSGIDSHRSEQALFSLKGANCNLSLTDSAAIYNAGQFGHSAASVSGSYRITLNRFLMQRCTTGGEYTDATFSVFDSAFIECPDDSSDFVDGDNDGLYLVNGTHGFTNCLFGWTKDDGIDSGASGFGVFNYQDCWFDSIFHEANSLSGAGKLVTHRRSVFINCGQGVEAGYESPHGTLDNCLAVANIIGGRFGDNYNWTYNGFLRATNSIFLYNYRDVWGMNWADWTNRTNQMDVRSNYFTTLNPILPYNTTWSPGDHANLLNPFFNGVDDSIVGVGLAIRTNRLDSGAFAKGIPVRLSRFSSRPVTIDYQIDSSSGVSRSGTLTFQPGETVKTIKNSDPDLGAAEATSLRISANPASDGAQLTGPWSQAYLVNPGPDRNVLVPQGAVWRFLDINTNLGTAWRLVNYDDSNWRTGAAQLGFGDQDEISQVASNRQVTTYFRHAFVVSNLEAFTTLTVSLLRDDGGIVYLNGNEVFRSNLPLGPVDSSVLATNALPEDETTRFYSKAIDITALHPGTNIAAVEIHQSSASSSDLSFDLKLSGNPVSTAPLLKHFRTISTVASSFPDQLVLYWNDPRAVLEVASDLDGPWVPAYTSNPYALEFYGFGFGNGRQFYRLRGP